MQGCKDQDQGAAGRTEEQSAGSPVIVKSTSAVNDLIQREGEEDESGGTKLNSEVRYS